MQMNADLNGIYGEFERHNDENSKQIESMQSADSAIYASEVESYKSDYARLQKANKILITEIKDLLCLCYGDRKVGVGREADAQSSVHPDDLLSKEVLTVLEVTVVSFSHA